MRTVEKYADWICAFLFSRFLYSYEFLVNECKKDFPQLNKEQKHVRSFPQRRLDQIR